MRFYLLKNNHDSNNIGREKLHNATRMLNNCLWTRQTKAKTLINNWEKVKVSSLWVGKYKVQFEFWTQCYLYVLKWKGKQPIRLYSNIDFELDKECLGNYLKRWKIEDDYKKMKFFWWEKVRLMCFKKVVNIMFIVQFIIMVWQDLYNEIMERAEWIKKTLLLYYKNFCQKRKLTSNSMSFLHFVSEHVSHITFRVFAWIPKETLSWNRRRMKKSGTCLVYKQRSFILQFKFSKTLKRKEGKKMR